MDCDWPLDCGCVAAWDHGAWSYDLTYTGECREGHSTQDALDIAEALRRGELRGERQR